MGSISGSRISPGEGNGKTLQDSSLGNAMAEEPGGLQSMGLKKSRTRLRKHTHTHTHTQPQLIRTLPGKGRM